MLILVVPIKTAATTTEKPADITAIKHLVLNACSLSGFYRY
jgi:hypothetical protein